MDDLTILHLSDLHINGAGDSYSKLLKSLLTDIKKQVENVTPGTLLIAVTGDILDKGPKVPRDNSDNEKSEIDDIQKKLGFSETHPEMKSKAIRTALHFFYDLKVAVGDKAVGIYIVPGNHDKKRTYETSFSIGNFRNRPNTFLKDNKWVDKSQLLDERFYEFFWKYQLESYDAINGTGYLELVKDIYSIFGSDETKNSDKSFLNDTFGVDSIVVNDTQYNIVMLNTAWSCDGDYDNRELALGRFQLDRLEKEYRHLASNDGIHNVCTVMMGHHPISHLRGQEEDMIFSEMNSYEGFDADIYLCGHTHERNVINRRNVRHSFTTLMSGIGWTEKSTKDYESVNKHYYSMYVLNIDLNSIEVYIRSSDVKGRFVADDSIYDMESNNGNKCITFPLKLGEEQFCFQLSRGKFKSSKGLFLTKRFINILRKYNNDIGTFRTVIASMPQEDKELLLTDANYDKAFSLVEWENKINDDNKKAILRGKLDSFLSMESEKVDDEDKKIVNNILYNNRGIIYENFVGFLTKICRKFAEVMFRAYTTDEIIRIHFRYLMKPLDICEDNPDVRYKSLCCEVYPRNEDNIFEPSVMEFSDLLKESFESGRSLVYSANKSMAEKKPLSSKWNNFITVVPEFDTNCCEIGIGVGTHPLCRYPYLTFGITCSKNSLDDILYCMDIFEFNTILSNILRKYVGIFKIDLKDFCEWVPSWSEADGSSESKSAECEN